MVYTKSILCQLNGGCMGCCGHSFVSKKKIEEAIKKNTLEFMGVDLRSEEELIEFRDRALPRDLRDGVCRNLIEKEGKIFCPLHPEQNDGRELRTGHCDINYLCRTAREFLSWSEEKQERFLKFIDSKKLDNIEYSMKMNDNSLFMEFTEIN
ncbi:hypothetical protein GOV03_04920 [Candidatus Woesearchaeota archaeon]|nr:hypothetical protein [Candidatus Woesearchaeota archaeon]